MPTPGLTPERWGRVMAARRHRATAARRFRAPTPSAILGSSARRGTASTVAVGMRSAGPAYPRGRPARATTSAPRTKAASEDVSRGRAATTAPGRRYGAPRMRSAATRTAAPRSASSGARCSASVPGPRTAPRGSTASTRTACGADREGDRDLVTSDTSARYRDPDPDVGMVSAQVALVGLVFGMTTAR